MQDILLEVEIGKLLRERQLKLAVGESSTGGLISHRIVNVPGSSEYFLGGVVAYAYDTMVNLLGIKRETLSTYGAVSREAVLEMAHGACQVLGGDIGISASGIAGPGGGTMEKPVGTTWIGLFTPDGEWACHCYWNGNRSQNNEFSAQAALEILMDYLQGERYFNSKKY